MAKVIWSPTGLDDIDLIAEYIARDSARRASLFVQRLVKAVERLEVFPQSGRIVPEIGDDIRREIIFGSFRIMYRIEGDLVWITGVVHTSRDWTPE